jgi:hypothetical protein
MSAMNFAPPENDAPKGKGIVSSIINESPASPARQQQQHQQQQQR